MGTIMIRYIKKSNLIAAIIFLTIIGFFFWYRNLSGNQIGFKLIIGIIVSYCVIRGLQEKVIINPYLLFSITPISLLIYDKSVSEHYLVDLSNTTYLIAIANFTAMLLGFNLMRNPKIKFNYNLWNKGINLRTIECAKYAKIFMILGIYPTIYGCLRGAGYLFSFNLNQMKNIVNSAPLSSIFQLFLYAGVVCAFKSKQKQTIAMCMFSLIVSIILNFSKSTVAMVCISVLVTIYTERINNKERTNRSLMIMLLLVAGYLMYESFDIYNNIRHDYDTNAYFQGLGYVDNVSQNLFLPYMYLISPWSNLQYIMQTTSVHTWGLWFIKPILGYLQLDTILGIDYSMTPRFSAFNTFSYISAFYIDFGFFGSIICSFIFGLGIMWIYRLYMQFSRSPYVITIWALNVYAIAMLFFNNHYLELSYPITILILMWLWQK